MAPNCSPILIHCGAQHLGPVRLRRAYYHCQECGHGRFPRDEELGVADGSLSLRLRRMVARVGSQEPFGQGSRDLEELA